MVPLLAAAPVLPRANIDGCDKSRCRGVVTSRSMQICAHPVMLAKTGNAGVKVGAAAAVVVVVVGPDVVVNGVCSGTEGNTNGSEEAEEEGRDVDRTVLKKCKGWELKQFVMVNWRAKAEPLRKISAFCVDR